MSQPTTGINVPPSTSSPPIPSGGVGISYYFELTKKKSPGASKGRWWFGYTVGGYIQKPGTHLAATAYNYGQGSTQAANFIQNPRFWLTWKDIKRLIARVLMNSTNDKLLIENLIQTKLLDKIPVRTGHTASTIFSTIQIIRMHWYGSHFFGHGLYRYPSDRPTKWKGKVRHAPPETGYGKIQGVNRVYKVPNVHLIRTTKGGNGLYLLNDPNAYLEPKQIVNREFLNMIKKNYLDRFSRIIVGVQI